MSYIDGHCHLADPRIQTKVSEYIAKAQVKGIRRFIQGGVGPEDWQRQLQLKKIYPEIELCFGLHPYWVADHSLQESEAALDLLSKMLPQAVALGETGLDFRPHIAKGSEDRQMELFQQQLELARVAHKPLVIHLVRAHEEAVRIFEMWAAGPFSGMIHSFNGSVKQAETYLSFGFLISVGGPVCRSDNQRLRQAVKQIPMEKLVLETDSPDQPPPGYAEGENEPLTLLQVAEAVSAIKGLSSEEVLDRNSQNLRKLFHL